jgi:hypothetical protein
MDEEVVLRTGGVVAGGIPYGYVRAWISTSASRCTLCEIDVPKKPAMCMVFFSGTPLTQ